MGHQENPHTLESQSAKPPLKEGVVRSRAAICMLLSSIAAITPIQETSAQTSQNTYSIIDSLEQTELSDKSDAYSDLSTLLTPLPKPLPFFCDDVSKKDKDKLGSDIPSPAILFETIKHVEREIKTHRIIANMNYKNLGFLTRMKVSHEPAYQKAIKDLHAQNNGVVANELKVWKRHQGLMFVINREKAGVSKNYLQWNAVAKKAEQLRKDIKVAVLLERQVGLALKRCVEDQDDIDPDKMAVAANPLATNLKEDPNFINYFNQIPDLPLNLALTPYYCGLNNQNIFRGSRPMNPPLAFLIQKVEEQLKATVERERAFLAIEEGALANKSDKKLSARLSAIYKNGRQRNNQLRTRLEKILVDAAALRIMAIQAEKYEIENGANLNRCKPNF